MRYNIRKFLDELLLVSGQYTLFYILLSFSSERLQALSIISLSLVLILQTALLSKWGHRSLVRMTVSFFCPLVFTGLLLLSGGFYAFNMNLLFFWLSSFFFAFMKSLCKQTKKQSSKKTFEIIISMGTIFVFLFLAFYYDLNRIFGIKSASGLLGDTQASTFFSILNFPDTFSAYLRDPANIYIVFSSLLIGSILALARIRIISLKYRITYLFEQDANLIADLEEKSHQKRITEAVTKEAVILYADIRNFSALYEKSNPNSVLEMLNLYFSTWGVLAKKYNGHIDKYIGDAIMIIFGLDDDPDAHDKAVTCAMDFLDQLGHFQEEFAIRNLPVVKNIGVGITSGEVINGIMGTPEHSIHTVIGNPVNVAARLENLCKEYKQDLIIDQNVYKKMRLENQACFIPLGDILLKGKASLVTVYGKK